jgi:hypothetical protein
VFLIWIRTQKQHSTTALYHPLQVTSIRRNELPLPSILPLISWYNCCRYLYLCECSTTNGWLNANPEVGWLIGLVKYVIWPDSLYFLHLSEDSSNVTIPSALTFLKSSSHMEYKHSQEAFSFYVDKYYQKTKKTKLCGLSPRVNYIDWYLAL